MIKPLPHGQNAGQDDSAKDSESCNARGLLLFAYDRNVILQMLGDPKASVGNSCEEQAASSPSVNEVQLLVSVTRTEEGDDRILRGEQEDDRELCDCQEAYGFVR